MKEEILETHILFCFNFFIKNVSTDNFTGFFVTVICISICVGTVSFSNDGLNWLYSKGSS